MCDLCKGEDDYKIKVELDGFQTFFINLCKDCKKLTKDWYIAFCRECHSIELWNKEHYAPFFNAYPGTMVEVTLSEKCMNCLHFFKTKH